LKNLRRLKYIEKGRDSIITPFLLIFDFMRYWLLIFCLFILEAADAQQLDVYMQHAVNGEILKLGKTNYQNEAGDTFNISRFQYYLSNFSLTDTDGKTVKVSSECFLVNEANKDSKVISLANVPVGQYKSISFMVGVDSLLNCTGAQTGSLDPINGMFWTWNSGYIMMKLEGTSPSSNLPGHMIEFHIGGYRAPHMTQRWVSLPLDFKVKEAPSIIGINIRADIATLLKGVNFRQSAGFMTPGAAADKLADSYQHMFSVDRKVITN
jgi:hypothetical protein